MRAWRKTAVEVLKIARDWTIDLDGAELVGNPVITVNGGGGSLLATYAGTDGKTTKINLSGGKRGDLTQSLTITVVATSGETLSDTIPVIIT